MKHWLTQLNVPEVTSTLVHRAVARLALVLLLGRAHAQVNEALLLRLSILHSLRVNYVAHAVLLDFLGAEEAEF